MSPRRIPLNKDCNCQIIVCLLCFSVIGLFPLVAFGEGKSGLELLRDCNGTSSNDEMLAQVNLLTCIAYISGITDANAIIGVARPGSQLFCPPKNGIQNEQYIRILVKWLNDHPDELHKSAKVSVFIAMSEAFPCNKQ